MYEQDVTLGPGTGTFTQHTLEIIIMLLGAFLFGLWLGWVLWNKYKQEADKLRIDAQSMTATVNALNVELSGLKTKLASAEANNLSLRAQVDKLSEDIRIYRDQLTETSEDLAETEQRNRQLETELGLSFATPSATPETIPLEIDLTPPPPFAVPPAEEPSVVVVVETPSSTEILVEIPPAPEVTEAEEVKPADEPLQPVADKPEETVAQPAVEEIVPTAESPSVVATTTTPVAEKDDLTVVEGIGPKIQELLYQYGILTYKQLADTEVVRLKEILATAGPQLAMHDPGTWSAQANLAANDKWEDLKAYQGFLKGGKTPVNPPG